MLTVNIYKIPFLCVLAWFVMMAEKTQLWNSLEHLLKITEFPQIKFNTLSPIPNALFL